MKRKILLLAVLGGIIMSSAEGFAAGEIYTSATMAWGPDYSIWIYWGTGNKTDPLKKTGSDAFYAVKDADRSSTYSANVLTNITTSTYVDASDKKGWYINMSTGEKILSDPVVWNKDIYFTSYTPSSSTDPCDKSGTAKEYKINYISGTGSLENGQRSKVIGTGIPGGLRISKNPYNNAFDLYGSTSGEGGFRIPDSSMSAPSKYLLYWRDLRIQ